MTNDEYVASLREMADWYEAHPGMPIPEAEFNCFNVRMDEETDKDAAQRIVRVAAPCKKSYDDTLFSIRKTFGSLTLRYIFMRNEVCERVVIATEEVPERVIPAEPERVEPAHVKEIVEWRCEPLLAENAKQRRHR